ncbi:hypothetical protein D9M72_539430 [compost metagenome]
MPETRRPSGFQRPATTTSSPQTRKAPTAALKPPSTTPALASSAAPGVDQAMLTGSRVMALMTIAQTPMEIDNAISPEAACASLAPTPVRPCNTTAKELAKPTKAISRPMKRLWGEKSRNMAATGCCGGESRRSDPFAYHIRARCRYRPRDAPIKLAEGG